MRLSALLLTLTACLSGCQTINKNLQLAEVPDPYPPPITKDHYISTIFGFYVHKGKTKIHDDGTINYQAVFDNRALKKKLASQYNANQDFKQNYPAFIQHEGKVNCRANENTYTFLLIREDLSVIRSEIKNEITQVSNSLCTIANIKIED